MGLVNTLGYYFREAFVSLVRNGWFSLASVGTIVVSLVILAGSVLLVMNLDATISSVESSVEISVFLEQDVDDADLDRIREEIQFIPGVVEVEFISKDEALTKLQKDFGPRKEVLEGLKEDNPLPHSFQVKTSSPAQVPAVARKIEEMDGVDEVNYGRDVVEKLVSISNWVRTAGLVLVVSLGMAAIFLIATSIRMSIFARRREIGIMKMLGATNWFIRFPFLLEGIFLGLFGGVLAALMVNVGYASLVDHLKRTIPFLRLITDVGTVYMILGSVVGLGVLIGAVGSVISLHRFLKYE